MRAYVLVILVSLSSLIARGQSSSAAGQSTISEDDLARIVGNAFVRGGAPKFLEEITDRIGGRITGSPESRATAELILKTLKEAGFEDAHFEEYTLPNTWQHGSVSGAVVSPVRRALYVGSYGWCPGTNGPVEVPLIDLGSSADGHSPLPGNVRGAAVMITLASNALGTNYVGTRYLITQQLARAGAAAMMIVSDKPDRMVYTSGFLFYPRGPLPVLSIAAEDAAFLRRLLGHGAVKIRLDVQNSFGPPTKERNVVADLPGVDSKEMVLLTAHFDSWDPAQGANDNGVGVAAVLDGARILKSLNIRPRHTIRFVFFSGEEQSDLGSRAYVIQHRAELDDIRAMINTDAGAQAPLGFRLYGRKDLEAATANIIKPLASLRADRLFTDADFESDEESFMVVGVPAYSLAVEPGDYYAVRHHTIVDTYERVDPRMLSLDSAVLTIGALSFADADQRPGKRLSQSEVHELLQRTNLETLFKMDYGDEQPY
ncbi:MAG TPA: M20/M25/M40 family metallo-hydrolase [Terriglobales bacterium]|nr:M20/M25/M40 family metallo-hydrolase [Terriglobales bacterium]